MNDPTITKRAWPVEMKEGDQIAVLLPHGYWTIGMLDGDTLIDFHDNRKEIGLPILYSDVLPTKAPAYHADYLDYGGGGDPWHNDNAGTHKRYGA